MEVREKDSAGTSSSDKTAEAQREEDSSDETRPEASKTPSSPGSTRSGSRSPDPNCAICLGKLQNKSFTDSCFHMFCFTCLQEWAKVRAVCPLCKQAFKSIIHNVRSNEDYDQYHLRPDETSPDGGRFRYRTTLTTDRWMLRQQWEQQRQLRLLQRPTSLTTRGLWHRMRQATTSAFRKRVYSMNMRAKEPNHPPNRPPRYRNISVAFFKRNTASTHRLVPWLNRELNVLLGNREDHVQFVLELILDLIKRFDIQSAEFTEHIRSFMGRRTEHFVHEFYHFARSPYDMVAYDNHAVYEEPEPHIHSIESDSSSEEGDDGDVIILSPMHDAAIDSDLLYSNPEPPRMLDHEQPPLTPLLDRVRDFLGFIERETGVSGWDSPLPGPSTFWPPGNQSSTAVDSLGQESRPHIISHSSSDNENDVLIVGVEKPWECRTPIELSSDEDIPRHRRRRTRKTSSPQYKRSHREHERSRSGSASRHARSRSRSRHRDHSYRSRNDKSSKVSSRSKDKKKSKSCRSHSPHSQRSRSPHHSRRSNSPHRQSSSPQRSNHKQSSSHSKNVRSPSPQRSRHYESKTSKRSPQRSRSPVAHRNRRSHSSEYVMSRHRSRSASHHRSEGSNHRHRSRSVENSSHRHRNRSAERSHRPRRESAESVARGQRHRSSSVESLSYSKSRSRDRHRHRSRSVECCQRQKESSSKRLYSTSSVETVYDHSHKHKHRSKSKKHKKHKKHKSKSKSKERKHITIESDSDIEIVEVSNSKEMTGWKKHPTGHKNSSKTKPLTVDTSDDSRMERRDATLPSPSSIATSSSDVLSPTISLPSSSDAAGRNHLDRSKWKPVLSVVEPDSSTADVTSQSDTTGALAKQEQSVRNSNNKEITHVTCKTDVVETADSQGKIQEVVKTADGQGKDQKVVETADNQGKDHEQGTKRDQNVDNVPNEDPDQNVDNVQNEDPDQNVDNVQNEDPDQNIQNEFPDQNTENIQNTDTDHKIENKATEINIYVQNTDMHATQDNKEGPATTSRDLAQKTDKHGNKCDERNMKVEENHEKIAGWSVVPTDHDDNRERAEQAIGNVPSPRQSFKTREQNSQQCGSQVVINCDTTVNTATSDDNQKWTDNHNLDEIEKNLRANILNRLGNTNN